MGEVLRGYFQFSVKEDGLYITVYPPKEGYRAASIDDLMYYIDKKNIEDCDLVKIKEMFNSTTVVEQKVSEIQTMPIGEFGDYRISNDCMRVEAVFYPPFKGSYELDEDSIIKDLQAMGVKHGIKNDVISTFLKGREYGKTYVVAEGTVPREGNDGKIIYQFDPDVKAKPKLNEDGTVDFHNLENVNHVKKGDVVAILEPEDYGDDGCDILGRVVRPRHIKKVIFRHGKNLEVSEDGLKLISTVNGHITLEGDKIFVSNVLDVVNVDNSTGDISYEGDVNISGNVLAGFSVNAAGNINISGIVEGATLISGGNITLARGVQGMNRAVLKAKGDIVTKFIESADIVSAGGNVETDTILHSKVIAKGSVLAKGRNGLIVGGDVKATSSIEAKTIGNSMGTATVVGVGVDPEVKKKVDELSTQLSSIGNDKIRLNQIISTLRKKQEINGSLDADKKEMLQKSTRNVIMLEQQLSKLKREFEEYRKQLQEDGNSRIKVDKTIYVGTKLMFGESYMFIKEKCGYCQFRKDNAEIKCTTL